jgi:hypothetical protein
MIELVHNQIEGMPFCCVMAFIENDQIDLQELLVSKAISIKSPTCLRQG